MRRLILIGLLGLAACDAGPSAVVHDGDGKSPTSADTSAIAPAQDNVEEASMPVPGQASVAPSEAVEAKDLAAARSYPPLPVPASRGEISATRYGDWPLWSTNRKYPPDDNAHYQFGKHGGEIGAKDYDGFVAAVHAFVHHPPAGTETLARKNGDTLFYNAHENVFAVMTKDGAPRTLFRPYEGAAYWDKQKEIEADKDGN